jgi:hypothetical protein
MEREGKGKEHKRVRNGEIFVLVFSLFVVFFLLMETKGMRKKESEKEGK